MQGWRFYRTVLKRQSPGPDTGSHSIYMRILALESSCDESAVAVYDDAAGLLAHQIHSQVDLHRVYGGVVPERASRDHVQRLLPMARATLADAKSMPDDLD